MLNADDKQDIANDAMLECFRKLESYNGESKFYVYACVFCTYPSFCDIAKKDQNKTQRSLQDQENIGEEFNINNS
jgi:DNA-directed RNA polymerase specialized sigma24 family protein